MTPLNRWVFLPLLLGTVAVAGAHGYENACVALCHARGSIPEIRGVCEYEALVLQSDAGRSAKGPLLGRCLTPCRRTESGQGRPPFFDGSFYCRLVRQYLIRVRGCSCNSVGDERRLLDWDWEDSSWMDGLPRDGAKYESHARDEELSEGLRLSGLSGTKERTKVHRADMLEIEEESKEESEEAGMKFVKADPLSATTKDPDSSVERPIDWEMWCMAQCDNGQGGSACNCDIIP